MHDFICAGIFGRDGGENSEAVLHPVPGLDLVPHKADDLKRSPLGRKATQKRAPLPFLCGRARPEPLAGESRSAFVASGALPAPAWVGLTQAKGSLLRECACVVGYCDPPKVSLAGGRSGGVNPLATGRLKFRAPLFLIRCPN